MSISIFITDDNFDKKYKEMKGLLLSSRSFLLEYISNNSLKTVNHKYKPLFEIQIGIHILISSK